MIVLLVLTGLILPLLLDLYQDMQLQIPIALNRIHRLEYIPNIKTLKKYNFLLLLDNLYLELVHIYQIHNLLPIVDLAQIFGDEV